MKRSILLVLMMLPIMTMAQLPQFDKAADKYDGKEGVTAMTINKQMIAMFAGGIDGIDMVDEVQILLSEDTNIAKSIIKDAKKAAKKSKVNEFISANNNGATFSVYTKSENDIITNIVVIVENDTPSGFIVISGNIPEDKIKDIVKLANL